jgi:subtilase family serine protease
MTSRRIAVAAVALLGAAIVTPTSPVGAVAGPVPVPNSAPAWLDHASHLGPVAASAPVTARVYLQPRGGLAALQSFVDASATPGSASYRTFLSPAQYQQRFGVSDAEVATVRAWLHADGLQVTAVGPQNEYLAVQGSAHTAQRAFAVSLQRYRHDGQTVQAPAGPVAVPAALASMVLTVSGLDTTRDTVRPASPVAQTAPDSSLPAGYRDAGPCSSYFGQVPAKYHGDGRTPLPKYNGTTLSYVPCGYVGSQLRAAYLGQLNKLTGKGVTVGVVDAYASPTITADINTYSHLHGDGLFHLNQYTQAASPTFTNTKACDPGGWYGEQTLDVEALHALAPAASIRFYPAASCNDPDFVDALDTVVSEDRVQVVANSWGSPESVETAGMERVYQSIVLRGESEGISFIFSSGDNGDEQADSGIVQPDFPASDPYVTAVGGTSAAIGANGRMSFQTGWGTDRYGLSHNASWKSLGFYYGSGGGVSHDFRQPTYQKGIVPGNFRQVPDVAMDGDPQTGMLVGETQQFPGGASYGEFRVGGTSLAAPLFAAFTALALQHSGKRAGELNPTIYAHRGDFIDVRGPALATGVVRADFANTLNSSGGVNYTVRTFNTDSSLHVNIGWDNVTGLGTPSTGWLSALG